ncbi:peptidase M1 [uncultured Jatrophihabitans sp.]|uniref:peptidase M1 n=1 Tax=uncultured Jatrophihabitans sp. TaxID=1610747 RepID=UPI0035C9BA46
MAGRSRLTRTAALVAGVATATLAAATLAACTSTTAGRGSTGSPRADGASRRASGPAAPSASPSRTAPSSGASSCPARYPSPDPNRPRMRLSFTVSDDLTTVTGREQIAFTPDRRITELVFRLTANTRPTVQQGNRIVVRSATADHGGGRFTVSPANAAPSTQGGLLHIPFASPVAAGTTVNASIAFTVTLGQMSFDRFGRTDGYAWFASAQPLLAWQRGYGWHTEDLIDVTAESATSEAMDVDLTVTAPGRDTVIASGDPADPSASSSPRTWHSHLDSARDVSVSVGPFSVSDTTVGGVKLRLGAFSPAIRDSLVLEFTRAIRSLVALLGPFPFPSLSVARLPAGGGGIEYPSSILMLDGSRLVAVHETAHQYFYAMVGDSQSLHPWLDEAFAQYTEERIDGDAPNDRAIDAPGRVDSSVESYGADSDRYYFTTYNKGAAALHAAERAAGTGPWDRALRCYVAANAWRIVVPADFQRAIRTLPASIAVLRKAGALP